jgi:two-component system, cell cycle response regulator DivK
MRPVPRKKPSPSDPLILLVDDVADNIDVYTQFFLHRGWRTATASNGLEGLTSAAGLRPDLIVLDLGMPGMDGWEVARRLKADVVTRSIPIIALTGHVLGDSQRRAREAGVEEFLAKPCLPQDLADAIKKHLRPR